MAAASRQEIESWFDEGKKKGATHMIVVCDSFDLEDYPVYVSKGGDVRAKVKEYADGKHPMQRIMEVYSLTKDKEPQINATRIWELD